uniref:Uncharacterized protein n=1 Tax=Siphoviridae sp. ctu8P6 TaxID=2827282 RepID=A0A8S5R4J3_9CAUD|nr:MAG TPA: hypothetical protein [Siphoviridae sp. ctu8P6]
MKKYTVKELAHLLDDCVGVVFTDEFDRWTTPEMFYTLQELVDKYGEHIIKWISFDGSDDEVYQAIVLEGDRE